MEVEAEIRGVLTPDLLKPAFRAGGAHPAHGHCYAASEALWHMLGGPASGLTPCRGRDGDGIVHWWLDDDAGRVLDPTAGQYLAAGKAPSYAAGRRGGFLTRAPSTRAREIMRRVAERIEGRARAPRLSA